MSGDAVQSRLVWTTRPPTVVGWYWLRHEGRPDQIVAIETRRGEAGLWVAQYAPLWALVDGLQWAGPISAPVADFSRDAKTEIGVRSSEFGGTNSPARLVSAAGVVDGVDSEEQRGGAVAKGGAPVSGRASVRHYRGEDGV